MNNIEKSKFYFIRISLVTFLAIIASVLLGTYSVSVTKDPSKAKLYKQSSFDRPNGQNVNLDLWQKYLAPLDRYLQAGISLSYLSQMDDNEIFNYIQTVLSPRRIGADVHSQYIYVISDSQAWIASQPELRDAKLLIRGFPAGDLYFKDKVE